MWVSGVSAWVCVVLTIFGTQGARAALTNVALNKPAELSSKHGLYGNPEKVVDGNKATGISQCAHTADTDDLPNRWWRVDLQGTYEVEAVKITNRGDCCGTRLADFDVYVMETLDDPSEVKHDSSDLCVHRAEAIAQGGTEELDCKSKLTGRYVSLVLSHNNWPLNFCEMEVLGTAVLTNVALNKPAELSSKHGSYGNPEKVVDGNTDTQVSKCAHTADTDDLPNRWWRVDLQGMYLVQSVKITNRGDCCGDRLADFDVYVMETLDDPSEETHDPSDLCVHHTGAIAGGGTEQLDCDTYVYGQYVSVVLPHNNWPLHFCEIEVLGIPLPALTNVALNKPAELSSKHGLYGNPEKVVDGNKATAISQCAHTADTDDLPNRWWRVDLQGMFLVEAVKITNRGDCCGSRMADFDVYVTDTLDDPTEVTHDPTDLCVHRVGAVAQGGTEELSCDRQLTGRYVSLVLTHNNWPLNFCEMEVLGIPLPA